MKIASDNLYHLLGHGVTVDIYTSWNDAFAAMQELLQRIGSVNTRLLTVKDRRTPEQKHPATAAKKGGKQA